MIALNRFLMQAAIGYPLTVHGTGGQTRAFIHIRDTVNCIRLAIENPPDVGDRVQIFNQTTETHRLRELAAIVAEITGIGEPMIRRRCSGASESSPAFRTLTMAVKTCGGVPNWRRRTR